MKIKVNLQKIFPVLSVLIIFQIIVQSAFLAKINKNLSSNLNVITNLDKTNSLACDFDNTDFKRMPNIIIANYDSGRADLYNSVNFPNLFKWTSNNNCQSLENHYSGGVESDGGHIAMLYSIIPKRNEVLKLHKSNFTSLPIDILKNMGYKTIGLSAGQLSYCWSISKKCDIHERNFDLFEYAPEDVGFNSRDEWLANRADELLSESYDKPQLIFLNFEATHYPYAYPDNYIEKYGLIKNVASKEQVNKFVASGLNNQNSDKIKNRYKNSLKFLDIIISKYLLKNINPDDIFVITSDHGEFLGDNENKWVGHTINTFHDHQTKIPLTICHKHKIALPTGATSHIDFFPSIFNIMRNNLQWNQYPKSHAFSTYPWNKKIMLTNGNRKIIYDESNNNNEGDQLINYWNTNKQRINNCNFKNYIKKDVTEFYEIKLKNNNSLCLDRKIPSDGDLHVYECWKGDNQLWHLNILNDYSPIYLEMYGTKEYLGVDKQTDEVYLDDSFLNQTWSFKNNKIINGEFDESRCISIDSDNDIIIVDCNIATDWELKET
tara:strand:+ start:617 stop:2260 length:1644 start_codon:yes stop_codon:yes gene_type:complete